MRNMPRRSRTDTCPLSAEQRLRLPRRNSTSACILTASASRRTRLSGSEAHAPGRARAERVHEPVGELGPDGLDEPLVRGRGIRIEACAVSGQERIAPPVRP